MPEVSTIIERSQAALNRRGQQQTRVVAAKPLTGGAASATWRLSLEGPNGSSEPAILRLGQGTGRFSAGLSKASEAAVVRAAHKAGIPAPDILFVLDENDGLGEGYAMACLPGEALPMKLLRDPDYQGALNGLTAQCAEALAHIHAVDTSALKGLPTFSAGQQLELYEQLYRDYAQPLPVFELTARWLRKHQPEPAATALVHGDFRMGNLLVTPEAGLTGVLDWELAHRGDPMEDLGWLCVNSWRFGNRDQAVGGFGDRASLYHYYEKASGHPVDPRRVFYWELFGVFKWGMICLYMSHLHLDGKLFSLEHAAIGRRVSETEIDMLDMLRERGFGDGQ